MDISVWGKIMKVKKKIIGLLVCMLVLMTIPLAAGIEITPEPEEEPVQLGSTVLRGIITKPRLTVGGHYITFRALRLHYRVRSLGETKSGLLRGFQKITVSTDFMGFLGNHYVLARFSEAADI